MSSPSRSERHGQLPRQTHFWAAKSPQSMHAPLTQHGECQPGPLPSPGPAAGTQGQDGPQVPLDWHVQEDTDLGCSGHHHRHGPVRHAAGHPAHRCRPELHLLVLERFLQLETLQETPVNVHTNTHLHSHKHTNKCWWKQMSFWFNFISRICF